MLKIKSYENNKRLAKDHMAELDAINCGEKYNLMSKLIVPLSRPISPPLYQLTRSFYQINHVVYVFACVYFISPF